MNLESKTEANVQQTVPFLWVANIEESVGWYVDGLGFEIDQQWVNDGKLCWCWLRQGGAALMLQELRKKDLDSPHLDGSEKGEGVSIYFICKDALAIYRQLIARGIQATVPFVGNGMWVTSLNDPDGYHILFESPTDMPNETVFDDN